MCRRPLRPYDFQLVQISTKRTDQVPATLQSVEYKCQIINNILKTTLIQTFRSQSENEYSETLYLFPVEDNICLESFEARYNENTVRGIVKSKEDAEKEYQDNKEQGNFVSYASIQKTPREEQVKIKLGNLPPNQQVEIVLTFSQQLSSILNKYYVAYIPLQYVEDEVSAKLGKNVLTLDLFCTGKITYASSKGYPAERIQVDENTSRFNLSQALLQKDMDFQLFYSYEGMFDPQVILGSSKIYNEDAVKRALLPIGHSAMVSFIPNFNKEITQEIDDTIRAAIMNGDDILSDEFQQKLNQELIDHLNSSRSEFIFLLDRSGSMSGKPIEKANEALSLFLKSLPNDSYFNVISFGSSFQSLFPQSKKYTSQTLKEATQKIKGYKADLGGTEIYQPLDNIFQGQQRIKGYNKQIFLLTDGAVSQPENVVNLIKRNNKFNRVHSIGFGSGADKFLIEQSAAAGKGISKIIELHSDLSEVIINMLCSSITPTYDDFTINYDNSIIDSTYPTSTNFPCVFKDEIINIHFFFKPLVDISTLSDAQKNISIEYYDSQLKQKTKKEIRLEMSDCFTCNSELQESVFKLGKQLYLNENISAPKNQGSDLLQQAIDFQLLTEKTALICVIETLNDEQKIMFNNIKNDIAYTNQEQQYQFQQQLFNQPPQANIMRRSRQQPPGAPQVAYGGGMKKMDSMQSNTRSSLAMSQSSSIQNVSQEKSQGFFSKVKNFFSTGNKSSMPSNSMIQPASSQHHSLKVQKKSQMVKEERFDGINNQEKKKMSKGPLCLKTDSQLDCFDMELKQNYSIPNTKKSQLVEEEDDEYFSQAQMQQQLCMKPMAESSLVYSIQKEEECGKKSSPVQPKGILNTKLENILSLVDNVGVWNYQESLIKQICPKLDSSFSKEFMNHFMNKDVFMTLFILCVLEFFYSSDKSKWILISKKSTSYIKQNMKEGEDFNSLKQNLLQQISI